MIQVYTGCGKGKTTAAIGLAMRASGAGLRVYIAQFLKGKVYSELAVLGKIKKLKLEQFGRAGFIRKKPQKKDFEMAEAGLAKAEAVIKNKNYDLVILDEINIALSLGLLKTEEVMHLIKNTPKEIELVLTGRHAPAQIIECADLVSEIKEVKHYYKKGIKARKGIEC